MTALQQQEYVVREASTMDAPGSRTGGQPRLPPAKTGARGRDRIGDGLARKVLAQLPLAVAVINADMGMAFWNEQAGLLFGPPPVMADERAALAEVLAKVGTLTEPQRARILSFVTAHLARGDRTEPDG